LLPALAGGWESSLRPGGKSCDVAGVRQRAVRCISGDFYAHGGLRRPLVSAPVAGGAMMAVALLLQGKCPLITNTWSNAFALFSGELYCFAGIADAGVVAPPEGVPRLQSQANFIESLRLQAQFTLSRKYNCTS